MRYVTLLRRLVPVLFWRNVSDIPKGLWQPHGLTVCCVSGEGQKDMRHSGLMFSRL